MQSNAQIQQNTKPKRKSLLVQMLTNQPQSGKSSPRLDQSGECSPLRKSSLIRTPTSSEKEINTNIYKTAYNAIVDQNFEKLEQVIEQLEITERNINSPLKTNTLDGKALIHLVAETIDPNNAVMEFIIESKGADISITDSLGNDALLLACRSGKLETVKYLGQKGLNYSVVNKLGEYGVGFAAFSGNLELIKFLAGQGVQLDKKNYHDLAPLDIAYDKNYQEIVDYLLENIDYTK